ncbi:MAG: DUF4358 domain-containing protein [Oscillospiraceae bacterium]|nr:DUF4358 domain-containing protein [Oscillospiraceae bacterium]
MKKIKTMLIAGLAVIMLAGCANNNSSDAPSDSVSESVSAKTPAEKTAELLEGIEHPEMVEVTSDRLKMYYKTEESAVKEFSAYVCGSGAMPDEFGVFVCTDNAAAEALKTELEARIEKVRETFADYTPAEMYKFDDSFVNVNGDTVSYAVCANNELAKNIFG